MWKQYYTEIKKAKSLVDDAFEKLDRVSGELEAALDEEGDSGTESISSWFIADAILSLSKAQVKLIDATISKMISIQSLNRKDD